MPISEYHNSSYFSFNNFRIKEAYFHVICIIIGEDGDKLFINKPVKASHIGMFMGSTWGPPGSCGPQMGPMLAPWTLLSGLFTSP